MSTESKHEEILVHIACLTLQSLLVTLGISEFNVQNFYVLPTECICVLCMDLRKNSDVTPYIINWLNLISETECVYCAVRGESLNINYINLRSLCIGFVVNEVALRLVFVRIFHFSLSVSFHQCSILIFVYTLLLRAKPRNFHNAVLSRKSGEHSIDKYEYFH